MCCVNQIKACTSGSVRIGQLEKFRVEILLHITVLKFSKHLVEHNIQECLNECFNYFFRPVNLVIVDLTTL